MLRHLLAAEAPSLEVEVDSAGTGDYHIGDPPDLRSQRAAALRGIDLSGLRARQVTADDFQQFDLILAMDRKNLRDLQAIKPKNSHATLRLFLDYAPQMHAVDVPDPYFGGAADFEQVLDLTAAAARGLIGELKSRA